MTSAINYLSINENFPVPGQDNDTQVFRDNFDTIKTSLQTAKDEITSLQSDTAKLTSDNDFGLFKIKNAVLENVREQKLDGRNEDPSIGITESPVTIDFKNGSYQIFRFGNNVTLDFLNFPGDTRNVPTEEIPIGVGKVTLELYGIDAAERTIIFSISGSGATAIKVDEYFPAVLKVASATDPVIIEVWRHRTQEFFMRYVGTFTS
jgi:hypothetical protein